MRKAGLIFLIIGGCTLLCRAQSTSSNGYNWPTESPTSIVKNGEPGIHEYGLWGGYSFESNDGFWGKTGGASLSLIGMRYNRKLINFSNSMLMEYVLKLNLLAWYRYPDELMGNNTISTYGFGATPIGFQLNWRKNDHLQPFITSSTGIIYLNNPFPDGRGTRINFTLELGGGIEIITSPHSSFTFGYRYHHMSNGSTGEVNPGVDSNLFYGAITFY